MQRRRAVDEWVAWRAKIHAEFKAVQTHKEEETEVIEEIIEEVLDETVEVLD